MRFIYLIVGEIGAFGAIISSIVLLASGIGSVASIFFFILVPALMAGLIFATFLEPKYTEMEKKANLSLVPLITSFTMLYLIKQSVLPVMTFWNIFTVGLWLILTLLAIYMLYKPRKKASAITLYKIFTSASIAFVNLLLLVVSIAFNPIKGIGYILALFFFIFSILELVLLMQLKNKIFYNMPLMFSSLGILLAGSLLSIFSIGALYLWSGVFVALAITLITVDAYAAKILNYKSRT